VAGDDVAGAAVADQDVAEGPGEIGAAVDAHLEAGSVQGGTPVWCGGVVDEDGDGIEGGTAGGLPSGCFTDVEAGGPEGVGEPELLSHDQPPVSSSQCHQHQEARMAQSLASR
jgi:hypothetical protein